MKEESKKSAFSIKMEQASKYREIANKTRFSLLKLIPHYEAVGYSEKKYGLGHGVPLGYAILQKRPEIDIENYRPGDGAVEFFWLDKNNILSKPDTKLAIIFDQMKTRGSIEPFDWKDHEREIIIDIDPYINAKSRKKPLVKNGSIYGHVTIKSKSVAKRKIK